MPAGAMDVIIIPAIQLINAVLHLYMWCIIASVVLSWLVAFNVVNTSNRVVYLIGDFLFRITEPALGRIRQFMPNLGGIDISPVVLILLIVFAQSILQQLAFKIVS